MANAMMAADSCTKAIISKELDLFFERRIKAASKYSYQIAQNPKEYSQNAFEAFVISKKSIEELLDRINRRLCQEFNLDGDAAGSRRTHTGCKQTANYDDMIANKIHSFKKTKRITAVSENIIDDTISCVIGNACSSNIVDFVAGNMGLGGWLLGGNSSKAQAARFQKDIFRHLKGMLINTKTKIKNELSAQWADYTAEWGIMDAMAI